MSAQKTETRRIIERADWFEGWRIGARGWDIGDLASEERRKGFEAGQLAKAEAAGGETPMWQFGWTEGAFAGVPRRFAHADAAEGARAGAEVHAVVRARLGL